jgi:hypothetical protein
MFPRSNRFAAVLCLGLLVLSPQSPRLLADGTNPPAIAPSPVTLFRQMLVMSEADLAEALMLRPPGMREPIEAKIKEYAALSPEDREVRLQATELRFYLLQLMPVPDAERGAIIAKIPEPMRAAVEARLETWSLFPTPMREELLENEQAMRYVTQFGRMTTADRRKLLEDMPAAQRAKVEADIARWKSLPEPARDRITAQLGQFFDLTPGERQKALSHLSEPEREAMEKTLAAFSELPPDKRADCVRSFTKFAGMSLAERQLFLKKAEAWQKMSPTERHQWREVVRVAPDLPPLPPGLDPPEIAPATSGGTLATNGR